ncbi:MAG TPA: transporter [Cyanobacteria bacterium UBA11049]|nr:transporter [Cyanobacteria bacterium UBA11049]
MKRHYLFHSLCSSLTLALLAAQPAKAEPPARVTGVSSPTVRDITVKPLKAKIKSGKSPSKSDRKLQTSIHKERKANRSKGVELSKYQIHSYKSNQLTAQAGQKPQQTAPTPSSNTNTPNPKLQQRPQQRPKAGQIDLPNRSVPVPNYLNPSPNPLRFPTKPEEVQILGAQPISLRQALELARRNNRQLQQAQLGVQRSQASLRAAQAAEYPRVNLGAGVTNQRSYIFSDEPDLQRFGQEVDANSTSLTGNLSLNYDLFTSGGRRARIRAAEEQLRNDRLDLERISEEVRLNVSTRYYDLQQADELVRIQQSAVRNAQASLRDAQALEQAGVGTRFDVLTSQVQVARATQDLANALSQQRVSRRQLAVLLSLPEAVIVTAADPVEIAGLWNLTQEQSIIQAYKNRAELEQQLAQRNINEQQRRIALATLGPQISLAARYNLSESLDSNNNNNNFQQNQDFTDQYSLGANVTLNLYDGGEARARAREAEANIAIAETSFANQRNQIRLDVEQAYSQLQSNFENIQTASVALEQAREALRLARLRFQAGVGTQTEVIDSENRLTQAEGDRVNAILSYNRALAQLQRAISSGQQS